MKIGITLNVYCTASDKHSNSLWKLMRVIQFEPERRIAATCDECGGGVAIDAIVHEAKEEDKSC